MHDRHQEVLAASSSNDSWMESMTGQLFLRCNCFAGAARHTAVDRKRKWMVESFMMSVSSKGEEQNGASKGVENRI